MNDNDIKYYEDMAEMFNTAGWEHLCKILQIDVDNMNAVIWDITDDRMIAGMQGHKKPLNYILNLKETLAAEFEELQRQALEDNEDADL